MMKGRLPKAQLDVYAYLSSLLPHIDLIAMPITDHLWDSFYVMAFGGNEYCKARGVRAALTMECLPDGRFTVLWESDDQEVVDDIMRMVEDYGRSPQATGHLILTGAYAPRGDDALPDHLAVMQDIRSLIEQGDHGLDQIQKYGGIVGSFEPLEVSSHEASKVDQVAPEMDYWRNYWGLPQKCSRPI